MNGRSPASKLVLGLILVGFYSWLIANLISRASGHSGHVTPLQVLAGVLVVYLGGLLWAVSFVGSALVAYPRSGPPALFTVGRGPRWARLNARKGLVDLRVWSWRAGYRSLASAQPISLQQERRILRATLWPGFASAAVLAALAFVLPGRAWILATAAVCGAQSVIALVSTQATGPIAQLRALKAYPAAIELLKQARIAMEGREYERALELSARALAEPHDATIAWQLHLFAGSACIQLGRFVDAAGHLEQAVDTSPNETAKATMRGGVADAKLSEALRTQTSMVQADLEHVRAWVDATPPGETDELRSALSHRAAMLRLVEGDPVGAVSLCEPTVRWLEAQPDAHSRPEWQVAAATLVIAYARSGRIAEARALLAQLSPQGALYEAAAASVGDLPTGA